MIRRRSPGGRGGGGDGVSGADNASPGTEGRDRPASGRGRSPTDEGVAGGGGREAGLFRVVVARTRGGLEAVELFTGIPLVAVALPAAASGAGVYVDLNGDGVVDHVQVSNEHSSAQRLVHFFVLC